MLSAILVSGNSQRHMASVRKFNDFLKTEVGVNDIKVIGAAYYTTEEFKTELREHLQYIPPNCPTLLYYSGHGGIGHWGFNEDHQLDYKTLADIIKKCDFPILIVNDCCYAHSIANCFQAEGLDEKKFGVISASGEDSVSNSDNLLRVLLTFWRDHEVYAPQIVRIYEAGIIEIVRNLGRGRDFIRQIHIYPKWKGILDRLRYVFLDFFDSINGLVLNFPQRIMKFFKKDNNKNKEDGDFNETIYETKRWGLILDTHFFPKT